MSSWTKTWCLHALIAALCITGCDGRSVVGGAADTGVADRVTADLTDVATDTDDGAVDVLDASDDTTDVAPVDGDVVIVADADDAADVEDVPEDVDVMVRCATDMDCVGRPEGQVCETMSGRCVECLASRDTCPVDRYCDSVTSTCFAGCRSDEGCRVSTDSDAGADPDAGTDGGASPTPRCDTRVHACVACLADEHCPNGTLCRGNTCVPGCDMTRPCPTGQSCCSGACVDTQTNLAACGACGRACAINNASPACRAGACAIDRCNQGFGDCNRMVTDGCETNLQNDITNCGMCGTACRPLDNATVVCRAGACVPGLCAGGFGDCDGMATNGCETELRTTPTHCGMCGMRCAAPANATATCTAGACGFTCLAGFADCDGMAANGCEVNTSTSATHCGRCRNACTAGANSTAACVMGACTIGTCATGFANCDNTAANGCEVDIRTNNANCGRCGTMCPTGQVCADSRCALPCPVGQTRCGTTCVVTSNDPANCGMCGRACTTGQLCGDGTCRATCGTGQMVCGRSCSTVATDPTNCGMCGRVCPAGQSCVAGACTLVCPTGQTACGLVCANTQTDNLHCGMCGRACRTNENCLAGVCTPICPTGQTACNGACVDLQIDANNCGMCGRVCPTGCYRGACGTLAAMDAAQTNNCLFFTSGRVFCFGQRTGLLYSSSSSLYHYWTPQLVTDGLGRAFDTAVELVLAQDRGCVRARDSSVQCWGAGYSVANVAGLVDVVDIDAREASTFLAATRDGRVFTWNGIPRPASNPATVVTGISDAVEVAGGSGFGCARRVNNSVVCWGANANGQLGNGTTTTSATPVAVTGLTDAIALAAGYNHVCAVRAGRTVVCWGRNDLGQLGDGTTMQRTTPVAVSGLTTVQQLRAGVSHTCAVLGDGSVRCWGANSFAQLGNGMMTMMQTTPVTVAGLPASRHVTTYHHHTCAIGRDDMIRCWGQNYWGEAGGGTEAQTTPIAVRGITNATDLQGGYQTGSGSEAQYHKCALLSGGTVQCWGSGANSNDYGQLGDGTTTARSTPAAVMGLADATQIAVEGYHNCALRRGGTVVCWGNNSSGQLGDGTTLVRSAPVAVTGLANVVEVQVGRSHGCARHTNGTVSCWGRNFHGELGDGTMTDRPTARTVPGITTAVSLQVGHNHSCVRLMDNTVRCWGRNIEGQLADGSNTNRFVPTQPTYLNTATPPAPVTLANVTALRCAINTCYARQMDGTARTWGGTSNLRVATDANRVIETPQWVAQGFGVTCQYRTDNNVWCTGTNEFGQVGVGRRSASEAYTMIMGNFSRLQSGYLPGVPCAIERTTGRVLCWGPTRYEYMMSAGTPALDGYTRAPAVVPLP